MPDKVLYFISCSGDDQARAGAETKEERILWNFNGKK